MSKESIKAIIGPTQGNLCALSGNPLPGDFAHMDVDRIIERNQGGTYTNENTRVVTPRAHMERHGNLREREEWLEQLKALMDDRAQVLKLKNKVGNQLLAYDRQTDSLDGETRAFLQAQLESVGDRLKALDKDVTKHVNRSDDPLVQSALNVPSVSYITVGGLMTYVDLEKARTASSLWAYTGLDKPSHERYQKGKASGGNKTLRTIVWNCANSMVKNRNCPYRQVYDDVKHRLENSEKVTKTRNTQGQLVESRWCDTKPGHRHHAALRAVMKHFLADFWYVGRTLRGLDTRPLYAEEYLGHTGIIQPSDRGWNF